MCGCSGGGGNSRRAPVNNKTIKPLVIRNNNSRPLQPHFMSHPPGTTVSQATQLARKRIEQLRKAAIHKAFNK